MFYRGQRRRYDSTLINPRSGLRFVVVTLRERVENRMKDLEEGEERGLTGRWRWDGFYWRSAPWSPVAVEAAVKHAEEEEGL